MNYSNYTTMDLGQKKKLKWGFNKTGNNSFDLQKYLFGEIDGFLYLAEFNDSSYKTTPSDLKSLYSPIQNPCHFSVIFVPPSPLYLCHILSVIGHFCVMTQNNQKLSQKKFQYIIKIDKN